MYGILGVLSPSSLVLVVLSLIALVFLVYPPKIDLSKMGASKDAKPEDFSGQLSVSQNPPTTSELAKVASLPILDSRGDSIPFSSLWKSRRTLVIFVRHFFCGNCQEYLRTLSEAISSSDLESVNQPIDIAVIGCGSHELIDFYRQETSCTFPLYTDPDRELFKQLGMTRTKQPGTRPHYQQRSLFSISVESILQGLGRGRNALKGGDFWQVGGEFLIEDGECLWAHRMTTTRDHSEIPEIRKVVGLDGGETPMRKKSSVVDGVKRRWSHQASVSTQGSRKPSHSPTESIPEVPQPRDSGVEVDR